MKSKKYIISNWKYIYMMDDNMFFSRFLLPNYASQLTAAAIITQLLIFLIITYLVQILYYGQRFCSPPKKHTLYVQCLYTLIGLKWSAGISTQFLVRTMKCYSRTVHTMLREPKQLHILYLR